MPWLGKGQQKEGLCLDEDFFISLLRRAGDEDPTWSLPKLFSPCVSHTSLK